MDHWASFFRLRQETGNLELNNFKNKIQRSFLTCWSPYTKDVTTYRAAKNAKNAKNANLVSYLISKNFLETFNNFVNFSTFLERRC